MAGKHTKRTRKIERYATAGDGRPPRLRKGEESTARPSVDVSAVVTVTAMFVVVVLFAFMLVAVGRLDAGVLLELMGSLIKIFAPVYALLLGRATVIEIVNWRRHGRNKRE